MAMEDSKTRVTILTETYRITGRIDLIPGARVTDYLLEAREFIAVTEAEVWEVAASRKVFASPFINVSRAHIQVVTPED